MRRPAFFPPGLDPVLDRGVGDEDAVIAPEVPTGGAEGQSVLDDQADRQADDAMGVVAAGGCEVGGVGVEVLAAPGTEVLRVRQPDVMGPAREEVAEVVEGARELAIAVGAVPAAGTGPSLEVAAASEDLGLGQVLDPSDAFGGVGAIFSGSWHGCNLLIEPSLSRDYGDFPPAVRAKAR